MVGLNIVLPHIHFITLIIFKLLKSMTLIKYENKEKHQICVEKITSRGESFNMNMRNIQSTLKLRINPNMII